MRRSLDGYTVVTHAMHKVLPSRTKRRLVGQMVKTRFVAYNFKELTSF